MDGAGATFLDKMIDRGQCVGDGGDQSLDLDLFAFSSVLGHMPGARLGVWGQGIAPLRIRGLGQGHCTVTD